MLARLMEERQRDLLRELERDRLVREAQSMNHPHRHTLYHALDWMGRRLIRWGERLQAPHAMHHRQTLNHNVGG
jgi:hypothetical protein